VSYVNLFLENILHVIFFFLFQEKKLVFEFFFTIKYVIFHCLVILKNNLKIIIKKRQVKAKEHMHIH
jgi:hypothetical protein